MERDVQKDAFPKINSLSTFKMYFKWQTFNILEKYKKKIKKVMYLGKQLDEKLMYPDNFLVHMRKPTREMLDTHLDLDD